MLPPDAWHIGPTRGASVLILTTAAALFLAESERVVTVTDGQQVVTSGPYRYVRHPSYAGLLLALAGIGLMFANRGSFLSLTVLPAVDCLARIRVLERELRCTLGVAYASYADDRPRLIPGVW